MNCELVANYNTLVTHGDFVLWCGDVSFMKAEPTTDVLSQMNGRKAIVLGNHDRSAKWYLDRGFEFAERQVRFEIDSQPVIACHYPEAGHDEDQRRMSERPRRGPGEWLIHGHTHSRRRRRGMSVHVGVDAWNYHPAPVDMIKRLMRFDPSRLPGVLLDVEQGVAGARCENPVAHGDCGWPIVETRDKWKIKIFVDCGEFDYIEEVEDPLGNRFEFDDIVHTEFDYRVRDVANHPSWGPLLLEP